MDYKKEDIPISIHALREEGDRAVLCTGQVSPAISIHALREEGDTPIQQENMPLAFLSTPSARRATVLFVEKSLFHEISIHALREEGDRREVALNARKKISIHALREEGDRAVLCTGQVSPAISIHALREEGDTPIQQENMPLAFLSTPSARRATVLFVEKSLFHEISIHALREEGDRREVALNARKKISIHALREEGDSKNRDKISIFKQIIQHSARI